MGGSMQREIVAHQPESPKLQSARLLYLDWLRVFAILFVFVYHSSRFFNSEDWHVKNPTTYYACE